MDAPPSNEATSRELCQNFYRFVCQKSGVSYDPTGMVRPDVDGEKQVLQIYKTIIQKHGDWTPDQVDEELVREVFTPERRARIKSAFKWVVRDIERLIDRQPSSVFNASEKRLLKNRLRKTQLELPPPATLYADEPDLITKDEVYYERLLDGQMRLRIGGGYLFITTSWFNYIFTFAHELFHSIDLCEVRTARLSFPAYDRLEACFLSHHLIATPKTRSECGEDDQLSEISADWVATQITYDALKTFATEFDPQQVKNAARNSVRDLCLQGGDDDNELDTEYHPSPQTRIGKIFGQYPPIRRLLGCEAAKSTSVSSYCTFIWGKSSGGVYVK